MMNIPYRIHFSYIRNQFIRNQGSTGRNFKKPEGSVWVDLRNFQIKFFLLNAPKCCKNDVTGFHISMVVGYGL